MTPTTKCPECRDDPRGVLLLNHYVPCKACLRKGAKTIPFTQSLYGASNDPQRLPGKRGGDAVRYRRVWRDSLGPSRERLYYQYVHPRLRSDGITIWVFRQEHWTEDCSGPKSMTYDHAIEWWVVYPSQEEAEKAFDAFEDKVERWQENLRGATK